jgi:TolB-like protein/Tfp pilus assembly protein PilF
MSDSQPTPTNRAVFLSYASQDAEAARHICEALCSGGVEVWFDSDGGLEHGDEWDAKIRRQIKECVLFIPVISANTQARHEGYFRIEWELAAQRAMGFASGVPFILPVVIDDTHESDALVPDRFSAVQWTRLRGGDVAPEVLQRFLKLWSHRTGVLKHESTPSTVTTPRATPSTAQSIGRPGATKYALIAVVIAAAGAGWWLLGGRGVPAASAPVAAPTSSAPMPPAAGSAQDRKSVAVLPFENLSTDPDNEFFAEGLQDEVITALAKIHDLRVISRTSVMAYKNPEGRNLKRIAAELGVACVLEGSVQRAGGKMHLNVQLIDARSDSHLWAESFTNDMTDVFTLEANLAGEISSALSANLTDDERALIARRPTRNQAAYDLYLRASVENEDLNNNSGVADYERVIALYDRAAAMDPFFAMPHVQASLAHGAMYWFPALDPTPERKAKARAELDIVHRLAPDAPETHLAQGEYYYLCENEWARALQELLVAEADLPSDAELQFRIGTCCRRLGRYAESLTRFERAAELDPNNNFVIQTLVQMTFGMRRYHQALDLVTRYFPSHPDNTDVKAYGIYSLYEVGGDRAAFLGALSALPHGADDPFGLQAKYSYAMAAGDLSAAYLALSDPRLITVNGPSIADPVAMHRALVAFLLGRQNEARQYADEAIASYSRQRLPPRQQVWARMGMAVAEACSGRVEDALRESRAALAEQHARDAYDENTMRLTYGAILCIANRREEALSTLRQILAQPLDVGLNYFRFDPVWSRLKDDPRFEQILQSAKPL